MEHSRRVGIHDQLPEGGSNGSGARSGKQNSTYTWMYLAVTALVLAAASFIAVAIW